MVKSVKLILKGIASITVVFLLACGFFAGHTILNAPLKIFENITSPEEVFEAKSSELVLETGSGTDAELLENYILFSNTSQPYKDWIHKNRKSLRKKGKKTLIIEKTIDLPRPLRNECKLVYCFQKRLGFEKIPPIFWKGLIGIEDERFLLHQGVDLKSLLRALIHDIKVMKLEQGGSTLTQQIVKNLFYTNEKKFSRKIKEMILAVYLESKYEKEKILEAYFNEVVWGGKQGIKIKGLYAASLFYFSKKPDKVTPYEAAILISLLKGPNFYNPLTQKKRLRSRAELVFKKLIGMNLFPSENGGKWKEADWDSWIEKLSILQKRKPFRKNWWLSNNLEKGELGLYERYVLHSKVSNILKGINERLKGKDIAAKAYIGDIHNPSSNYFYYSKYERNWLKAKTEERHVLGSTIKPLIYSVLVGLGSDMESEVETGPLEVNLKSGIWKPREAHKIKEKWVTLKRALKLSYNRPIIREVINQGFEIVEPKLEEIFPRIKKPLAEYPAQLLGTVEVTLEELFNIYKKFIINDCKRGEKSVVRLLSDPRETTIRRLVGKEFGGLKFFGKTGTSNNGFDNWFVFYEGNRLGVIWIGLEGERSGGDLKLYGGTTSFQIFKKLYLNSGKRFGEFICGKETLTD